MFSITLATLFLGGPVIDTTISIGSIINVIILLVGFAASWYKMEAKTEHMQKELESASEVVTKLSEQIQLLSLTAERLSTLSEINEKRWDVYDRHIVNK